MVGRDIILKERKIEMNMTQQSTTEKEWDISEDENDFSSIRRSNSYFTIKNGLFFLQIC